MTTAPAEDIASLNITTPPWFKRAFEVPRSQHSVDVDGTAINYFRWGDPAKPGVVLTHGFMAHGRCWAFIAPLLAEKYQLAAIDLSGMGDSGWRDHYNMEFRAKECRAVAVHAGFGPGTALVCHSYGGSVGLTAAMTDPDNYWSKLIVCDMTMLAPGEMPDFIERRQERMQRGVRPHKAHATYDAIRARFRLAPDQPCQNDYLMDYMAYHSVKQTEGGYVWKFDPRIMGPDEGRDESWFSNIAPNFCALTLPRGIIYGEHSEMMSAAAHAYIHDTTEGSIPSIQIADAYHHIMLDQPIALAAAIDSLLQTL